MFDWVSFVDQIVDESTCKEVAISNADLINLTFQWKSDYFHCIYSVLFPKTLIERSNRVMIYRRDKREQN
jgi:hypothetical protein